MRPHRPARRPSAPSSDLLLRRWEEAWWRTCSASGWERRPALGPFTHGGRRFSLLSTFTQVARTLMRGRCGRLVCGALSRHRSPTHRATSRRGALVAEQPPAATTRPIDSKDPLMAKHSSDAEPLRSPSGDDAGVDAIDTLLSAEQLRVGRERIPTRIARLQKFIVTEQRTITVEVRHEEARLVYEDVPAGEDAAALLSRRTDDVPELVLHEERIEVTTRVVPVERVRAVVEQVTERREVSGEVRVERVEVEDAAARS
ncbi:hypothetical protein GCM10025783_05140 [Amnibacterium soli]|uniref:DUF2382 domain-containing protein n=2 Tax=Amnibacterium soli TaxID=1282736 RepID=A0ABP8YRD7_9MICO